jgi:hypothetical protein
MLLGCPSFPEPVYRDGSGADSDGPHASQEAGTDGPLQDGPPGSDTAPSDGPGAQDTAAVDTVAADTVPWPDKQVLAPDGAPCSAPAECESGHCRDGVCCNTVCTGICRACDLPGKIGTCTPIPNGKDPDNECAATAADTCGDDGTCDGQGACRKHAAGTVCAEGQCSSNETITGIKECDGQGACVSAPDVKCFPYACNTLSDTCYTSCNNLNEVTHCYGYYGCSGSTCNSSCNSDSQCNYFGECDTDTNECVSS